MNAYKNCNTWSLISLMYSNKTHEVQTLTSMKMAEALAAVNCNFKAGYSHVSTFPRFFFTEKKFPTLLVVMTTYAITVYSLINQVMDGIKLRNVLNPSFSLDIW